MGYEFKLQENKLSGGYYYLSKRDSKLYDRVKDSCERKDMVIKKLLLDKAIASRAAHCSSTY